MTVKTVSIIEVQRRLAEMKLPHVDRTAARLALRFKAKELEIDLDELPQSVQEELARK